MSNLIDDCKKYLGISPYDNWFNVVICDTYFYKSICEKYGEQDVKREVERLRNPIKYEF